MPDKRLHILFLPSWYPNKTSPQNGDFIQRHAQAVSELCDVTVLFLKRRKQNTKIEISDTKQGNLREIIVYFNNRLSYLKIFRNYFITLNSGNNKFDLVHLNVAYPAGILALYLKKRYKLKYIYTEHWSAFINGNFNKFFFIKKLIIKNICKQSQLILPVSEYLANAMKSNGITNKYQIIQNVVDNTIFYPANKKSDLHTFRFLHVSSLNDSIKNISGILRAASIVSTQLKDFQVIIAGNDNYSEHKRFAAKLGLNENCIRFYGNMPQSQIADLMRSADCFLLFSNYETSSCVVSEAHVCGLPVISSAVGGVTEKINTANGVTVEKGNVEELAKQMYLLIKSLRFEKSTISDDSVSKYSYQAVGAQIYQIYKMVLDNA